MSDIDWPALLALEGQATAGPWVEYRGESSVLGLVTSAEQPEARRLVAWFGNVTLPEVTSDANAAFIAASRTAVPALVALVRGLAGALEASSVDHGQGPCWCSTESASGRYLAGMDNHQHWSGCSTARAALATIPAALRAGVGDGE